MLSIRLPVRVTRALLAAALLAACGEGVRLVQPPPPDSTGGGGGGGGVQKATLTIEVEVDSADAALASPLGWGGGVPGAEVTIRRIGSTGEEHTAMTDAAGVARFTALLPGFYSASVLRPVLEAERVRLGQEGADVTAFGGGDYVEAKAPASEADVAVVAGRRGSLVFSEFFASMPRMSSGAWYRTGHYWEIYNNADTTVYLGGKVLARGLIWLQDYPTIPCDAMERWRLDLEGVWTGLRYAFPGGDRSYPLKPGETAVIATDAIDHRTYAGGLQDLSGADFEFIGSKDVDNPRVPNMVQTGGPEWVEIVGRGLFLSVLDQIWVLADAVREESLVAEEIPYVISPTTWKRIPADKVLDVWVDLAVPATQAISDWSFCDPVIPDRFDRRPSELVSSDALYGIHRRTFAELPDGRVILQRTRTSARDFETGRPSPGRVE